MEHRIWSSHLGNRCFLSRTVIPFFLWLKYICSEKKKVSLLGQRKEQSVYPESNVGFKAWMNVMNCMGNTMCFYDVTKCDLLAGEGAWNSDCTEFNGNFSNDFNRHRPVVGFWKLWKCLTCLLDYEL